MLSLFCWSFAAVASDNELIFDLCKDNKGNWTLVKEILCYFFLIWLFYGTCGEKIALATRTVETIMESERNYEGKYAVCWGHGKKIFSRGKFSLEFFSLFLFLSLWAFSLFLTVLSFMGILKFSYTPTYFFCLRIS